MLTWIYRRLAHLAPRFGLGRAHSDSPLDPRPPDLKMSHLSVHLAAAPWAAGRRVVEVGCRDGAGLALLATEARPESVRGYDGVPRSVRAGRRRFGLDLRLADLENLPESEPPAGLLLAVHLLPRLAEPDRTLDWMAARRSPQGRVVVAVRPVIDEGTMAQHRSVPELRTHRFVWEWELAMRDRWERLTIYRHLAPAGARLDFSSTRPSQFSPRDFRFEEITPAEIDELGPLALVFVGEGSTTAVTPAV